VSGVGNKFIAQKGTNFRDQILPSFKSLYWRKTYRM